MRLKTKQIMLLNFFADFKITEQNKGYDVYKIPR